MTVSETIERCAVVLVRPENPENIGLVARGMKNTGFSELRLAGIRRLSPKAYKTAVHAAEILDRARLFTDLDEATADLQFIAASTAKPRKIGSRLGLAEAAARIAGLPDGTRVGLLFGNERTGLTGDELRRANIILTIPQASRQPSYNLGAAVLLTLYALFTGRNSTGEAAAGAPGVAPGSSRKPIAVGGRDRPLSRREQDEVIGRILEKLATKGFIHRTNKVHVTAWIHDLFGRLAMTGLDRGFLLALFEKGVDQRPGMEIVPPDDSVLHKGEKKPF
jgi:TrmH family RNA methyltransferase